jgi:hypothetical protein
MTKKSRANDSRVQAFSSTYKLGTGLDHILDDNVPGVADVHKDNKHPDPERLQLGRQRGERFAFHPQELQPPLRIGRRWGKELGLRLRLVAWGLGLLWK